MAEKQEKVRCHIQEMVAVVGSESTWGQCNDDLDKIRNKKHPWAILNHLNDYSVREICIANYTNRSMRNFWGWIGYSNIRNESFGNNMFRLSIFPYYH